MKVSSWVVPGLENVKQMEHGVELQRNVKVQWWAQRLSIVYSVSVNKYLFQEDML